MRSLARPGDGVSLAATQGQDRSSFDTEPGLRSRGETIDIVATCVPRVIGQVKDYIEGYREPKEDWEE